MTRLLLAVVFIVAVASPVFADGYGDFNAGVSAASRFDHDAAIRLLSAALADADLPEHLRVPAYLARGGQYFEKKQFDAALADFGEAIKLGPDRPDTFLDRCVTFAASKLYKNAIADCSSAIQLQPENWLLRQVRISLCYQINDYDDILADYAVLVARKPQDAGLLLQRADIYQRKGDFANAITDAQSAKALDAKSIRPNQTLQRIYFAEGDFAKAADADNAILQMEPDSPVALLSKGETLWAMGQFDDASRAFSDSLSRNRFQGTTFLWLSIAQAQRHDKVPDDIVQGFSGAALDAWPGALVQLYLGKSKPDAILSLTGQDASIGDDIQCSAQFFVGAWYQMQGDLADAKRLFQSAANVCRANTAPREAAIVAYGRL